ncbi:MAG: CRISPR-associated protein Cas4 [Nanopusillaceae archaeon]
MEERFVRVTDITDYLFCPRKVYLKRVLGYEEETNEKKIFGSIVHNILDNLNEREYEIVYNIKENRGYEYVKKLYEDFVLELIDKSIKKFEKDIKKLNIDVEKIKFQVFSYIYKEIEDRSKNIFNFMSENDLYGIELWYSLEPKILTEFDTISRKYNIIGRVDRIEKYNKRKEIIPYEIKSGFFSRDHITQIYTYYLLLKDEFPDYKIYKGYIYYVKDNKKFEIEFTNKNEIKRILEIKDKILDMIESEKDPGKVYKEKCQKCVFYNVCWKNGNKN